MKTPTLKQTLEGAERASKRVAKWPKWKRELSMPEERISIPVKLYRIEFKEGVANLYLIDQGEEVAVIKNIKHETAMKFQKYLGKDCALHLTAL